MAQIDKGNADGRSPTVSDELISKVGTAVGHIAAIQQSFGPRVAAATSDDEKLGLQKEATVAAAQAINDQGLTVEEYNAVVVAAQDDTELEQRLLEVASAA
jgi:hypothetical protein